MIFFSISFIFNINTLKLQKKKHQKKKKNKFIRIDKTQKFFLFIKKKCQNPKC
jgi:hypothetical protein